MANARKYGYGVGFKEGAKSVGKSEGADSPKVTALREAIRTQQSMMNEMEHKLGLLNRGKPQDVPKPVMADAWIQTEPDMKIEQERRNNKAVLENMKMKDAEIERLNDIIKTNGYSKNK